jgi:hypothetical protein
MGKGQVALLLYIEIPEYSLESQPVLSNYAVKPVEKFCKALFKRISSDLRCLWAFLDAFQVLARIFDCDSVAMKHS